ncbi:hypothetical protein [Aeromicrobium sp. UC242_57]|uniref:hypothetical protein n=1 Tax=Aeromicrobium sp. UC242_57 TaxID=3374624 RepID=UPI00379D742C
MSTQQPPTSAERVAARSSTVASTTKQLVVLAVGMTGAGIIAGVLGSVSATSNPIWVLPVIVSGFACFLGLLATTAWSMRSRIGLAPAPLITSGVYLGCVLAVGGLVAMSVETPRPAYLVPLAAAAAVAALSILSRARVRGWHARQERLRSGAHAAGQVTDDGLAVFADSPTIKLATITITFRDLQGVQRWVTSLAVQSLSRPIQVGDDVEVWFDGADPGNLKRIVVEHDNGVSRLAPGKVSSGAKR